MMNKKKYDVIVAGAGPAGFCSALAAARAGASVLLIESSDSILGNITAGPLEAIMTFHDEKRQIIKGIPQEFIERCAEENGSPGHVPDTTGYAKTITPFSPETAKYVGMKMLKEAGITLLLQTIIRNCTIEDSKIKNIGVISKTESMYFEAGTVVDCTGDGDLAVLGGCDFELGTAEGRVQPMTSLVQIGGVNDKEFVQWVLEHQEEFHFFSLDRISEFREAVKEDRHQTLHLWGFYSLLKSGFETGALSLERKEMHAITGYHPGEVILNYTRVQGDPLSMLDRSYAQMETVIQGFELWKWMKKEIPAFKDSWIVKTGRIGIREGRRIIGDSYITKEDLEQGKLVIHPVAMGAFPMDIHSPEGSSMEYYSVNQCYQIPMGSLIAKDLDNLLMGGRCISCSHEAQASLRITATAMATGQAAGVWAAFAEREKRSCRSVTYEELRQELLNQDMILE